MKRILTLTLFSLVLTVVACSRKEEAPAQAAAEAPAAAAPAPEAPIGPISSRGSEASSGATAGASGAPSEIHFALPSGWAEQPPQSAMRLAQAEIPGAAGAGQLVVFYFGPGGGGTVDANIERWIGQVDLARDAHPQPQSFQTDNGFKVTWIDVPGTLKPSGMGMGPEKDQPNSRLLGGIVEGPGGPWFFKATGPDATLAAERDHFVEMLRSVRGK